MERSLSGSSIIGSNSLLSTSSTFGNHADKLIGRNPMDASFTVCVRIRPPNQREISGDMPICFIPTTDGTGVEELDCDHGHTIKFWHYDHVFGPELGNREIFSTVGVKLADAALDGYNAVGFVYGQTSSGNMFHCLLPYHDNKQHISNIRELFCSKCILNIYEVVSYLLNAKRLL